MSAAALAQAKLADVSGRWEVMAVELRPNMVQALTVDDPNYMGSVLEVTSGRLAFVVKKGGELNDVCVGPRWAGALVAASSARSGRRALRSATWAIGFVSNGTTVRS
jgi:hypothetical protein